MAKTVVIANEELVGEIEKLIVSKELGELLDVVGDLRARALGEPMLSPHLNCIAIGFEGIRSVLQRHLENSADTETSE